MDRYIYYKIYEYLGDLQTMKGLDAVCKDSHGIVRCQDTIVEITSKKNIANVQLLACKYDVVDIINYFIDNEVSEYFYYLESCALGNLRYIQNFNGDMSRSMVEAGFELACKNSRLSIIEWICKKYIDYVEDSIIPILDDIENVDVLNILWDFIKENEKLMNHIRFYMQMTYAKTFEKFRWYTDKINSLFGAHMDIKWCKTAIILISTQKSEEGVKWIKTLRQTIIKNYFYDFMKVDIDSAVWAFKHGLVDDNVTSVNIIHRCIINGRDDLAATIK